MQPQGAVSSAVTTQCAVGLLKTISACKRESQSQVSGPYDPCKPTQYRGLSAKKC